MYTEVQRGFLAMKLGRQIQISLKEPLSFLSKSHSHQQYIEAMALSAYRM